MKFVIKMLATGLGTGYLKPGPGTWGSLFGLILAVFVNISLELILVATVIGIYICQKGEEILQEHDSPRIVFDEIIGMWVALWNIPLYFYPLAFVLFRFFDISKVYPINRLQQFPGGWGIMLDDLASGMVARIIIGLILFIF